MEKLKILIKGHWRNLMAWLYADVANIYKINLVCYGFVMGVYAVLFFLEGGLLKLAISGLSGVVIWVIWTQYFRKKRQTTIKGQ